MVYAGLEMGGKGKKGRNEKWGVSGEVSVSEGVDNKAV
jgi:hypothetical protein